MKGIKDMAKLVFNYGAMGSSKTANALMVAYNYEERGQHALILKPATDTRDGIHTVSSRIGLSNTCRLIDEFLDEFTKNPDCVLNYNAIIVDEAQFASPEQIDLFSDIVDTWQIPVLCYGLRADFQNKFFPGSRRLMEIADEIKEIKFFGHSLGEADYSTSSRFSIKLICMEQNKADFLLHDHAWT